MRPTLLIPLLLLAVRPGSAQDELDFYDPEERRFVLALPEVLHISGRIDGSGRIVFTRDTVRYEHKHWDRPSAVSFDGRPWTELDQTPAAWNGNGLDLTKAWIVERRGRDTIALEHTPDGFHLYLCDSPNGGGQYEVTLAIPRRPRS